MRWRRRTEQHDRRASESGSKMRDPRIAADDSPRDANQFRQLEQVGSSGKHAFGWDARHSRDRVRALRLVGAAGNNDVPARLSLGPHDLDPAFRRPAPRATAGPGMNQCRIARRLRERRGRRSNDIQVMRIGRNTGMLQQLTPARDFVFFVVVLGTAGALRGIRSAKRYKPARPRFDQ